MQRAQTQHRQSGSSVVEMALLLPLVLVMLFAIVDYGRFFYLKSMAASVASDAARAASLPGADDAAVAALVAAELNNAAEATPAGYSLGVTPQVTISPATRSPGDMVSVTFQYPFEPLVLPQFLGVPLFPAAVTAGASAMVEP